MHRMKGDFDMIRCDKIGVDCVINDPVDVRIGGPEYLGFDFFVPEEKTEEMKKFICDCLIKYEVPLISIYNCGKIDLDRKWVWNKEKIEKSIIANAEDLINEANRGYGRR